LTWEWLIIRRKRTWTPQLCMAILGLMVYKFSGQIISRWRHY